MANILLIATGGTRAPTQIELAERFTRDGHAIRLIASKNALRFLFSHMVRRPATIPAYLRNYRPALRETLAYFIAKPKSIPHISEGKWADVVVMAPATCNSVSKLASGVSDNYPLLVLRAIPRTKRVIVVPSMNPEMWYDPMYQRNIDLLNATEKYRVLCPSRGQMLSGDWGIGAQVSVEEIVNETYEALGILDKVSESLLSSSAGTVPWAEEATAPKEKAHILLVDPDTHERNALVDILNREYPDLTVHPLASASQALVWTQTHQANLVLTELDFQNGASGFDLIQHLRRPGQDEVQIIATSKRSRQEVGAERLGRLDVLFVPKPLNLPYTAGMITGSLRQGARHRTGLVSRVLAPKEILFREGEQGSEVYIVRSGRLRIMREEGGQTRELGFADPGEMVGEMAFLDRTTRSATIEAVERSEVAALDAEKFREYLDRQPIWLRMMLHSLVGHIRESDTKLAAKTE